MGVLSCINNFGDVIYAYLHNSRILFAVTALTKFDGEKSINIFMYRVFHKTVHELCFEIH